LTVMVVCVCAARMTAENARGCEMVKAVKTGRRAVYIKVSDDVWKSVRILAIMKGETVESVVSAAVVDMIKLVETDKV
jgi:hypothetical protein